jgi:hypothetical protein
MRLRTKNTTRIRRLSQRARRPASLRPGKFPWRNVIDRPLSFVYKTLNVLIVCYQTIRIVFLSANDDGSLVVN